MKLFLRNLFFFLLASGVWHPVSVQAARWTEIYNPRFWGTASFGAYVAPGNVTLSTTTGGVYTNVGTTNTWAYHIYGTNSQGRTPISAQTNITFAESSNANAVAISWDRLDGISGYVLEKSFDAGATWTNHFHYAASITNATDWQYSSFSEGSNITAEITAYVSPWLTNEPTFAAWLIANTYVKSNTGDWSGTWMGLSTGAFDLAGSAGAVQTDLDNHKTNIGVHAISAISGLQIALDSKAGTGLVFALQGRTGAWDQASADASAATNHAANTNNPHAVTPGQIGAAGTGDVFAVATNLAAHAAATNNPHGITAGQIGALTQEVYLGTITGATIVTGAVASVTTNGGRLDFTVPSGGGGAGTITNLISSDTSVSVANPGGPQPNLSVTGYVAGVVAGYVPTNDPALTNARPPIAHNQGYQTITGAPWIADASGWSAFAATQAVSWIEYLPVTNLYLTSADADPNVTGIYTQYSAGKWHNDNGFFVWLNDPGLQYGIDQVGTGNSFNDPAWQHNPMADYPVGTYAVSGLGSTGTITVAYSFASVTTNIAATWKLGFNVSNNVYQLSRDGVVMQSWYAASNVSAQPYYGDGSHLTGITADVPVTNDLMGATNSLNTRMGAGENATGSLNIAVGNLNSATGSMNTVQGNLANATNALNTRMTNAEVQITALGTATNLLNQATNALNTADGLALPKTFTNTGIIKTLQITTSPTNGAVWLCTNTATGEGKWSWPVAFHATIDSPFIFSNGVNKVVVPTTETFDLENNYDLTNFVAPVTGLYRIYYNYFISKITGASVGYVITYINSGGIAYRTDGYLQNNQAGVRSSGDIILKLTNNAVFNFSVESEGGHTNQILGNAGFSFVGAYLIRELP